MRLQADGQAQVVGETVAGETADDQPAPGEEGFRVGRAPARREADQDEVRLARRDVEPETAELLDEPGPPLSHQGDGLLLEVLVPQ